MATIVCLVDDDAAVRKSIGRLLEAEGLVVESFDAPEAFLTYLERHRIALAILDIWMDHMTGMELLAHLCARSPETPVIFITGRDDPAARVTVMQTGAFAFLLKPLDDKQFLDAVRSALTARFDRVR